MGKAGVAETIPAADTIESAQETAAVPDNENREPVEEEETIVRAEFYLETKTVMLNSGYEMPIYGLGTYSLHGDECIASVKSVLSDGIRLIDTASAYGNELKVFWEHFDKNSSETDYVNAKILASKGVMRKFINEIVRDIEWEDGKPCIEIFDDKESGDSGKMINIIKTFEVIFNENDDEKQRDRYLFQLYDWIGDLEKKKIGTIKVQEILNDLDENERLLYSRLMKELCNENLMKYDADEKMYHWIGRNPVANNKSELFTDNENKVIRAFSDAGARAERMLQCAGTYVELPDVGGVWTSYGKQRV